MEYLFNNEGAQRNDEPLPFAVSEQKSLYQLPLVAATKLMAERGSSIYSHHRASSGMPGLAESILTDDSSEGPSVSSDGMRRYLETSSTILDSSLSTVPLISDSFETQSGCRMSGSKHELSTTFTDSASSVSGFSQLMQAADDNNLDLGQSRMPVVPENDVLESFRESTYGGELISAPTVSEDRNLAIPPEADYWIFNLLSAARKRSQPSCFDHSARGASSGLNTPLLSLSPSAESVNNAKAKVRSSFEDHDSFQVSMKIDQPCTVAKVMEIIGNPAYLKMWCDPIKTLVVVNSTDTGVFGQLERDREYEGEWIEATTTTLDSPPCSVSYMHQLGNMILETVGLGSHGEITMFVERSRGKVSLTVGPFAGGIHVSHTISILGEEGGLIRVVDRVRIQEREEDFSFGRSMFFGGVLDSCFSSCLLPQLGHYMDQVKTSMARLQILVEIGELSKSVHISAPRWWQPH